MDTKNTKTISGCLPGTNITTTRGFIPIEDVKIGDEVLTTSGVFKNVINTFNTTVHEEILIIKNKIGEDIRVTKDCEIFSKKYSNIRQLPKGHRSGVISNNIIPTKANELEICHLLYGPIYREVLTNDILQQAEFYELLGMYIGDGNVGVAISRNGNVKSMRLNFSLGKNYPELIERCKHLLSLYSGNGIGIVNFKNHVNVVCYDTKLARMIGNICGYAKNKNIPLSVLTSRPDLQKSFIFGWYETDGCRSVGSPHITIASSEHTLVQQMLFILKRLNLLYSVSVMKAKAFIIENRKSFGRKCYIVGMHNITDELEQTRTNNRSIYHNNYLIFKFTKTRKESYSGLIYNLEIADDNSYVANGVAFPGIQSDD